jgi:hypothetical protein
MPARPNAGSTTAAGAGANAPAVRHHTTQAHAAYDPPNTDVARPWRLLVAGLLLVALVSLSVRSVCRPEVPGANEWGFGVRHEQRGQSWYHCEPWIRRALRG